VQQRNRIADLQFGAEHDTGAVHEAIPVGSGSLIVRRSRPVRPGREQPILIAIAKAPIGSGYTL
jgi:hypothetical protein